MIDGPMFTLAELAEYREKWKAGRQPVKSVQLTYKDRLLCVAWAKKLLVDNRGCFSHASGRGEFAKFQRDIEEALARALAGKLEE